MLNSTYKIAPDVVSRSNQDGTIVLMKMDEGNSFFKIEGIAVNFWNSISTEEKLDKTISSTLTEYDVTSELLEKDISHFLSTLLSKKLIQKIEN